MSSPKPNRRLGQQAGLYTQQEDGGIVCTFSVADFFIRLPLLYYLDPHEETRACRTRMLSAAPRQKTLVIVDA